MSSPCLQTSSGFYFCQLLPLPLIHVASWSFTNINRPSHFIFETPPMASYCIWSSDSLVVFQPYAKGNQACQPLRLQPSTPCLTLFINPRFTLPPFQEWISCLASFYSLCSSCTSFPSAPWTCEAIYLGPFVLVSHPLPPRSSLSSRHWPKYRLLEKANLSPEVN